MPLMILPAIDLKGGRCVRLAQGRSDKVTVYGEDPVAMAQQWEKLGAEYLHIVDLDGAFMGQPAHLGVIESIAQAISIPFEVGGGLRTDEDVDRVLMAGASRAIIGTRAWAEPENIGALARKYGSQLAVGIDARNGKVQIKGWTETTKLRAVDLAKKADLLGVHTLIVTDTATDGMLKGTNVEAMREVCEAVRCKVLASGGISSKSDVRALLDLDRSNLIGAIVGKALYEGRVTLKELKSCA